MLSFLIIAAVLGVVRVAGKTDPCAVAIASEWVSSAQAHACELNVPFNKTRSLAVVDSALKSLQYYSLENWFLASPNPLIPHNVNIRSLLTTVQAETKAGKFKTDWDFNRAVSDAYDREADGHSIFEAACAFAFSYNLPFSIATLAAKPTDPVAVPTFLVNYDFPNQGRDGLEAYYQSLKIDIRPFDGARLLKINGEDASSYLVDLAQRSSLSDGLLGSFEDVEARFMRLMSRYSADTVTGDYTQEVGRFGQRVFYPGATHITVTLLKNGKTSTLSIPWAATFTASGTDTPSFITETCLPAADATEQRRKRELAKRKVQEKRSSDIAVPHLMQRLQAVEKAGINQDKIRQGAVHQAQAPVNLVAPTLTSFGHFVTLDIYQLQEHPKVGVVYFEQFEPSDGTDANTYFNGISNTLFTGLTALKAAGVEKILVDTSGNRGGFIFAGAISLWSLWPQDLYPGFPAVFRDLDLTRRESDAAAATADQNSEYYFGFYRDLNYTLLTSNAQFLDPPVPQTVNGVADAYSQNLRTPPFAGEDYVFVANGICASTCSIFSSYLFQKHGVRSAVFGGTPSAKVAQFDGGVKGSEVTDFDTILFELELAGLQDDPAAPQPFPIAASLTYNYRNAIPYIDQQDGILEFVYEADTQKFQFTPEIFNRPQAVWEYTAEQFFGNL
ncbi:hypothetical protein C8J56DRAFT_1165768 [Mycena floridula]|nr:hypothetical protein C8J56DRAFT_1165768 [Mycena floridula]